MNATAKKKIKSVVMTLILALVPLVFVGTSNTVVAEDPPESSQKQAKLAERIRVLRALKIEEHFDLDEKVQAKLIEVLDKYDTLMLEQHRVLNQKRRKLRRTVRKEASDDEIERLRLDLLKSRKQLDVLRYERLEKASAILEPRDRVKLMVFLPKFEKKVRKVIKETRHKRRNKRRGGF